MSNYKRNYRQSGNRFIPGKTVMMDPSAVIMMCSLLRRGEKPLGRGEKPLYIYIPSAGMRVLEWGSGGSTLLFSRYVLSWNSIEHDRNWAEKMKVYTAEMSNVRVDWVPNNKPWR